MLPISISIWSNIIKYYIKLERLMKSNKNAYSKINKILSKEKKMHLKLKHYIKLIWNRGVIIEE